MTYFYDRFQSLEEYNKSNPEHEIDIESLEGLEEVAVLSSWWDKYKLIITIGRDPELVEEGYTDYECNLSIFHLDGFEEGDVSEQYFTDISEESVDKFSQKLVGAFLNPNFRDMTELHEKIAMLTFINLNDVEEIGIEDLEYSEDME
jgi:hypothetical protein